MLAGLRFALMVTTATLLTRAPRMATTDLSGSRVDSSSELVPGSMAATDTVSTAAVIMAEATTDAALWEAVTVIAAVMPAGQWADSTVEAVGSTVEAAVSTAEAVGFTAAVGPTADIAKQRGS